MEKLFNIIYFAGMVGQIIVRAPYERQRGQMAKADQRVSGAERAILGGLTLLMLVLPLAHSLTSWLNFANYPLSPRAKTRAGGIGTLILAAALWLFWRAHHDLGANWSPSLEIGEHQTLTTQGVYRRIRHPMYASQALWGLAQALLLPNWLAGWGGVVAFLLLYLGRVPQEEQMMLDHFGDAYRAYSARTGRIFPRIVLR
jgi:protein-S-isoprenylcysteine O-methyltransferase Ste14